MKKIMIIVLAVMLTATVLPALAFAETQEPVTVVDVVTETEEETDVGILPDSPFYGLKLFLERIQVMFTFNQQAKAERLTQIAERRLAELEALSEELQAKFAERLLTAFADALEEAEGLDEQNVTDAVYEQEPEKVTDAVYHQSYLTLQRVYEQVPDQAKPAIERAMEVSQTGKLRHQAVQEAKEAGEKPGPNLSAPGRNKVDEDTDVPEIEPEEEMEEENVDKVQTETLNKPTPPTPPKPAAPETQGRNR
jgi:hypothetical protein